MQCPVEARQQIVACPSPLPQACAWQSEVPAPGMLCQVVLGRSVNAGAADDDLHLRAWPCSKAHMVQAACLHRVLNLSGGLQSGGPVHLQVALTQGYLTSAASSQRLSLRQVSDAMALKSGYSRALGCDGELLGTAAQADTG